MDDADLAGPIVFSFAFAFVLLLVSYAHLSPQPLPSLISIISSLTAVWQTAILLHLRRRPPRHNSDIPPLKPHVRYRNRRLPHSISIGLLSHTHDLPRFTGHRRRNRSSHRLLLVDNLHHMVYALGQLNLRRGPEDGPSAVIGRVSCGAIIWLFRIAEHIQREEVRKGQRTPGHR